MEESGSDFPDCQRGQLFKPGSKKRGCERNKVIVSV